MWSTTHLLLIACAAHEVAGGGLRLFPRQRHNFDSVPPSFLFFPFFPFFFLSFLSSSFPSSFCFFYPLSFFSILFFLLQWSQRTRFSSLEVKVGDKQKTKERDSRTHKTLSRRE